jgi:hypothetical protein
MSVYVAPVEATPSMWMMFDFAFLARSPALYTRMPQATAQ